MTDGSSPGLIRVWEFDVPELARTDFEQVYGADGAWTQLFARSAGYEGTELFASLSQPGRYLTVDRFCDEASWHRFHHAHQQAYLALGAATAPLTVAQRELA